MATIKKYNGSTWENTIARKYETKSEIIVPPTTIYADGSNITAYTIKGNTVQNGTPTPTNPIAVNGVGELVGSDYQIPISSGGVTTNIYLGSTQTVRQIKKLVFDGTETWGATGAGIIYYGAISDYIRTEAITCACSHFQAVTNRTTSSTSIDNSVCFGIGEYNRIFIKCQYTTDTDFKQFLAQQYANGTPVTIWYVLATPETAAVNEPLMKIGTYADTLSNAVSIPTTEGANSITVDTTVQPSEFTATWTGWHDASVKEWDGSDWQ